MAVRKLKPTSAGRRFQTVSDFEKSPGRALRSRSPKALPKRPAATIWVVLPAVVVAVV